MVYIRLNELKIPWITGAWLNDINALQRIRNLFSQFDYLITNSVGSHIPYAGYCGCKILMLGMVTIGQLRSFRYPTL